MGVFSGKLLQCHRTTFAFPWNKFTKPSLSTLHLIPTHDNNNKHTHTYIQNRRIGVPELRCEPMPKAAFTGNWLVAFRVLLPMVMAMSQFVAYLLMLVVGERRVAQGRMMGLRESVRMVCDLCGVCGRVGDGGCGTAVWAGRVPACGRVAGVATGGAVQLDGGICDGAVL